VVAIDRDPVAVALTRERFRGTPGVTVLQGDYGDLGHLVDAVGLAQVDGILIDAGLSSMQLNDAGRGFSFQQSDPLDMRMDTSRGKTAAEYLAHVGEDELADVLRMFGDVPRARAIARAVCARRTANPIRTTDDLVAAIKDAFQFVSGVPEETRRIFQAIRIAVNDELASLTKALDSGIGLLRSGGRLVVISFHSGEDRIVKQVFQRESRPRRQLHPDGRLQAEISPRMMVLTKTPIRPSEDEIRDNPRAHSARLRAAERL